MTAKRDPSRYVKRAKNSLQRSGEDARQMAVQLAPGSMLNIVPITFSTNSLRVGEIEYTDEDNYRVLREAHWQTHVFRYDSRSQTIINVSLSPSVEPIGEPQDVNIQEHLLLVAKAIQHALLLWVVGRRPILKGSKQLIFWGQADQTLLLSQAFEDVGLEPNSSLEVPLRYEIDCRMFLDANDHPFLGMVLDVRTANVIEVPVSELMQRGMDVVGRYVARRKEEEHFYLHRGLELLGEVRATTGHRLLLSDAHGSDEVDAGRVLLEPRLENLEDAIRALYPNQASAILRNLHNRRQPVATAAGKFARIRQTLAGLKKLHIVLSGGIEATLGELLQPNNALFPASITTERPTLLFGPQGRNVSPYPDIGIRTWGPFMYMQHTRNTPLVAIVCEARHRGSIEQFANSLCNGLADEDWTDTRTQNPYRGGLIGKFRLSRVRLEIEETNGISVQAYRSATRRLLERLTDLPDLALIQIRSDFERLPTAANPYLATKAAFMTAGVPTQAVKIEKVEQPITGVGYILNTIGLASYAKLDGIPWVISTRGPVTHELVIGIGSAEVMEGRLGTRNRYVGMTTVFQGDGRYLVWDLTREAVFEEYAQALLDALKTVISFVQVQNGWQAGDKVRIVCHVYKRLKDCEVNAVKTLVHELVEDRFVVEFAFLDISWSHPYRLYDPSQHGVAYYSNGTRRTKGIGIPERGQCLQLDRWRALMFLTGPKDIKTDEQGLPAPLLVELHPDSDFTDLTYLVRQINHFTYMSWQGFTPATEPVTIKYSRLIARLLGNLRAVPGWDSTVLSVGSLRGRRWFL